MNPFILQQAHQLDRVLSPYLNVIGAPLSRLFSPFYDFIDTLDSYVHLTPNILIFLLCTMASFAFGAVHMKVPRGIARHVYSAAVGLFFCFLTFQWMTLHALLCAAIVYMSMLVLPIRWSAKFAFAFCFTYLSACHFYRMAVDYLGWSMDFSTIQMLITLKLISVPFNVLDGKRRDKDELYDSQRALSLSRIPNPIEFLGYLFFYPAVFSGPVFEFKHYQEYSNTDSIPSDGVAVWKRIVMAIIAGMINLIVAPMFPASLLRETALSQSSFIAVVLNMYLVVTMSRFKYYVAWYLGEASCINAGFGYTGTDPKTGKHQWKNVDQVKMLSVELSANMYNIVNLWNMGVSRWLRQYVYCRIGRKPTPGKRVNNASKTYTSFAVSALWHGFYSGYYLFWFISALLSEIGKELHRKIRPRVYHNDNAPFAIHVVYKTVGWVISQLSLAYAAVGFILLSWSDTVAVYNRLYWSGHIVIILAYLVLAYAVSRPRSRAPSGTPNEVHEDIPKAKSGAKSKKTRKD